METVSEFQQSAEKFNLILAYEGNPLVNAMCVGLINHEDIKKGKPGVGNTVMYVGAKLVVTAFTGQLLHLKN